jgi:hypothetical protein
MMVLAECPFADSNDRAERKVPGADIFGATLLIGQTAKRAPVQVRAVPQGVIE